MGAGKKGQLPWPMVQPIGNTVTGVEISSCVAHIAPSFRHSGVAQTMCLSNRIGLLAMDLKEIELMKS